MMAGVIEHRRIKSNPASARRSADQGPITAQRSAGVTRDADGGTCFRIWAPFAKRVELVLEQPDGRVEATFPMDRDEGTSPEHAGYHDLTLSDIAAGQRYRIRLDGKDARPDPCSLWQPDDIAGPSAVYYPEDFPWTDSDWRGVARDTLVIYELHIGTFTPAGTFEAAIERLDDLIELGITAIEIMPVGQFPGDRNWGYDGALIYAAQHSYGGPLGLQRLVDAAHAKGLAVILDVVYNHLGPEDNYIREFGPYFTDKYKTPWGEALNYDDRGSEPVRAWVMDNARMWLDEFHFDGLRLDAVHAIFDLGATHILRKVHDVADEVRQKTARKIHIIAESDLNDPRIVASPERGGYGLDAQWSDDFHHAVHALLTDERRGYYVDYGDATHVADVLRSPFLAAGEYSKHRGRRHGAPPFGIPGDQFVVCIQNHDQVGNRAIGDRLSTIVANGPHGRSRQRLAASLLLFAPHLPMLFMGEEYGEERPFPFFCSFHGKELIEAVRAGRKREFADFVDESHEVPDPDARETFDSAKLSWDWSNPVHGRLRNLYRDLLKARRAWPALLDYEDRNARLLDHCHVIEMTRGQPPAECLQIWFNLSMHEQPFKPDDVGAGKRLLFSSDDSRYGGHRVNDRVEKLLPFECVAFGPAAWKSANDW